MSVEKIGVVNAVVSSGNIAEDLISRMKILPPVTTPTAATQIKVPIKGVTTTTARTTTMKRRVTFTPGRGDLYDEKGDHKSMVFLTPYRGDGIKPFHVDTYTTIDDVKSPGVSWTTTKYDIDYKKAELLEQRTWSQIKPDGKVVNYTDKMFESQEKYNKKVHVYREMTENVHDPATGSTQTKFYRFMDQEVDSSKEYDDDRNTILNTSAETENGHESLLLPAISEEEVDVELSRELGTSILSLGEEMEGN